MLHPSACRGKGDGAPLVVSLAAMLPQPKERPGSPVSAPGDTGLPYTRGQGPPIPLLALPTQDGGHRGYERPPAQAILPSRGSVLHSIGSCRPCVFHLRGECWQGEECQYCHYDHRSRPPPLGIDSRDGTDSSRTAAPMWLHIQTAQRSAVHHSVDAPSMRNLAAARSSRWRIP